MAKFDSTKFSYELIHDTDCECPLQGDEHEVKIAYLERSRYTLGNEPVSEERMDEIAAGIRSGELIGVPVYAYVHGGVALRAGSSWHGLLPQGHAEFDSGQSGFVYISKADALKHWFVNAKRMSAKRLKRVREGILSSFKEYASWVEGDCWGYVIKDEDGQDYDSCWGFIGHEYATEEAEAALKSVIEDQRKAHEAEVRSAWNERRERRYWAARDVVTA